MFKYLTTRGIALISLILIASSLTANEFGQKEIAIIALAGATFLIFKLEQS